MGRIIDLTGQRFGRLTVLRVADKRGKNHRWECQCDCGNVVTPFSGALKAGNSQSCGCLRAEKARETCLKRAPPLDPDRPLNVDSRDESRRAMAGLPDQVACASPRCGRMFKPLRRNNIYCSDVCKRYEQVRRFREKHGRGKSDFVPGASMNCVVCGRQFVQTSAANMCCSRECSQRHSTAKWRKANPDFSKNRLDAIRVEVLTHYGHGTLECTCCGERETHH